MALATGGAVAQTQPAQAHPAKLHPAKATSALPREALDQGMTTGASSNMQNEAADSKGEQAPAAGGSNTNNMGSHAGGGAGSGK